jgi:predicted Zn-dependent protease
LTVQPIQPPDTHYLSATIGWLELGNLAEAKAELLQVSPEQQNHPDVLEVRWAICAEAQDWQEGLEVSQELVAVAPGRASGWLHQAYALRRVTEGNLQRAWDALLPAAARFPEHPLFAYNLACYACQMGQVDVARDWLTKARTIGVTDQIKEMALKDADLEPLWPEIQKW